MNTSVSCSTPPPSRSSPNADRRLDVAADRLAVHLRQPLHRPEPLPGQPQPEHLSNLEHTHLPERHGRLLIPLTGTAASAPLNGTGAGGPAKVVPSLALRWSHATGATQLKVVPSSWRATVGSGFEPLGGTTFILLDPIAT